MGESIYPSEAKAIVFLLTAHEDLAPKVIRAFEKILGPVEIESQWFPFEHSHYYEKELGQNLKRCLVGFKNIFKPWQLPKLKKLSRKLERRHIRTSTHQHNRAINIDPGYVDLFKFVLASGKAGGQKVALAKDVHVYTLLRYEKGKWNPFEWTYPDFKDETYHRDLLIIRNNLRRDLKSKIKNQKSKTHIKNRKILLDF